MYQLDCTIRISCPRHFRVKCFDLTCEGSFGIPDNLTRPHERGRVLPPFIIFTYSASQRLYDISLSNPIFIKCIHTHIVFFSLNQRPYTLLVSEYHMAVIEFIRLAAP